MFKNIEIMEINRKAVMRSTWVSFTALYLIMLILFLMNSELSDALVYFYASLIFGAPVYIPAIIIFLFGEKKLINSRATKKTVALIFLGEAILSTLAIAIIFPVEFESVVIIFGIYIIVLLIRFGFLLIDGRIYNKLENSNSTLKSVHNA